MTTQKLTSFPLLFWLLVAFQVFVACSSSPKTVPSETVTIGSRLELMLDDYLIESSTNLNFDVHQPQPAEKVMTFEAPWEGPYCDYFTVFQDESIFRMYYATHPEAGFSSDTDQFTCYAESTDAIHWTKPSLGIVEYLGSKDNNIINRGWTSHNFSPFPLLWNSGHGSLFLE